MSCYNARTDVNDIKCRIEPKTVALRLLCKSVYVVVFIPISFCSNIMFDLVQRPPTPTPICSPVE